MSNVKTKIIYKIFPIILLLIASSFLIFYKYNEIPKGLTHDENELARVAFSLENKPYTPFTPVADGHGTPYFYSLLLSFKIFGVNQFALRLPSRIFGILNIVFFYLILQLVSKNNDKKNLTVHYSLITSLLLLNSRWFLHFSRVAFEVPFLLLMEQISIYFILVSFKTTRYSLSARHARQYAGVAGWLTTTLLSGIFAGIAFNSYQPGRIFFLIPLFLLFVKKVNKKQIFYYLIAFIISIIPISTYLLINPNNDIRINQQFFLKNSSLSSLKKAEFLGANILNTSLMFISKGDMHGVHNYTGKPALNPIFFIFFFAGLVIALKNYKKIENLLFLSYFAISLAPTIFTYPWENPNMLRTYTALPAIIYFAGLSILTITNYFQKIFFNKYLKYLLLITCYLLLIVSTLYELRTYFIYQPLVFKQAYDKPDYLKIIRSSTQKNE